MSIDHGLLPSRDGKALSVPLILCGLAVAVSMMYLFVSKPLASMLLWISLFSLLFLAMYQGKKGSMLLISLIALSTVSIYQSSIPIGYRSWHYLFAAVSLIWPIFQPGLFRKKFLLPVYFLIAIAFVHLAISGDQAEVSYSFQQIVGIMAAAGFAILVIKTSSSPNINFITLTRVCVISLAFALLIPNRLGFVEGEEERIGLGLMMDPNGIALVALGLLLFLYSGITFDKNKYFRFFYYLLIVFVVLTILKTGSRQGGINFAIMTLMFLVFMRSKNGAGRIIPFVLALGLILVFVTSTDQFDKYLMRYDRIVEGKTSVDRLDHFKLAVLMAIDNPLGLGPGGFMQNFRGYAESANLNTPYMYLRPHNLFALALADWGILAFFSLLVFFVNIWRLIWTSRGTPYFPLRVSAFFLLLMNAMAATFIAFVPLFFCLYAIESWRAKTMIGEQNKFREIDGVVR